MRYGTILFCIVLAGMVIASEENRQEDHAEMMEAIMVICDEVSLRGCRELDR